jgi:PAS domain-containing protein
MSNRNKERSFRWGDDGKRDTSESNTTTTIQIHPDQQRINQYILAEMAKLKGDNKRLNDEVLLLKMENLQLSQRINTMPSYGLPISYPQNEIPMLGQVTTDVVVSKPQQELPFVEFDMRRTPPTVQSANVMFCSLLGYTTEEVLGKPWQYFIQDE